MTTIYSNNLHILDERLTSFGPVWVYEYKGYRCLTFANPFRIIKNQSCSLTQKPHWIVLDYIKMMMAAFYFTPEPKKVLMLGLGGGSLYHAARKIYPHLQIDIVEINEDIIEIFSRYFSFKADDFVTIHHRSAQDFVKKKLIEKKNDYDAIFVDVFNADYIPQEILTMNFFYDLWSMLSPSGVIAVNTFSHHPKEHQEETIFKQVFKEYYQLLDANKIIIATKNQDFCPIMNDMQKLDFASINIQHSWLLSKFYPAPFSCLQPEVMIQGAAAEIDLELLT